MTRQRKVWINPEIALEGRSGSTPSREESVPRQLAKTDKPGAAKTELVGSPGSSPRRAKAGLVGDLGPAAQGRESAYIFSRPLKGPFFHQRPEFFLDK